MPGTTRGGLMGESTGGPGTGTLSEAARSEATAASVPAPTQPTSPTKGVEAGPVGLSPIEMGAWRGFLNAHAHVIRRLEAELEVEQSMPLANYDVLVQLAEAPDHALRMSELASSVLLSRSGLTRLVDRLEREGL